ncbi:MAG: rhodanese-like domain-containing protein [Rhodospirillales bacterium]|nr:rhodanese-like domain-containing protein [Alphaproteobacteria bacterium]MBL6928104.1 rhodanese-like domain-containing protein [Rhodospirillales bacterium]
MSIRGVDPITLKQWIDQGDAVLVDVREDEEYADEHIAMAHHLPLSSFDPAKIPGHKGRVVVYHCASGRRTAHFGAQLTTAVPAAGDVYHLDGGIYAWKEAGLATNSRGVANAA